MKQIIRAKDYILAFFAKYGRYLDGVIRFVFAMVLYMVIIFMTGYSTTVSSPFIAVLLAAAAALLPAGMISVIACLLIVVEMTAVSLEIAMVSLIFIIVMLLTYYVFRMGDSYLMAVSLLFCLLRVPAMILPLAMLFPPLKIIPVIFGIVLYGIIIVVRKDFSVLAAKSTLTLSGRVNLFLSDFFTNERLLLALTAVVLCMLVIRLIRTSRLNYAPMISMITGNVLFGIVMIFGNYYLNAGISYAMLTVSLVLNLGLSALIIAFRFNFDYKRTEEVQFEDDEYYYYVRAIPKTSISVTDMRFESISSREETEMPPEPEADDINTGGVFRNKETDEPSGEE